MAHPMYYVSTTAAQEAACEVIDQETTDASPCADHVITRLVARGFDREQARRALQALLASGDIEIGDDAVTVTR